jgi:anti-sigma-K factor RskA
MDYSRPERAQRLAADYALGTMRGAARRRMQALLQAHPALSREVARWEDELLPLAQDRTGHIPRVVPSPAVWQGIARRLWPESAEATNPVSADGRGSLLGRWWRSLPLWRAAAAVGVAAALMLMTLPGLRRPAAEGAPILVMLQATPGGVQAGAAPDVQHAVFVASVSGQGGALSVMPMHDMPAQSGRDFELWAVPKQGAPRSLGVMGRSGVASVRRADLMKDTAALAVSLEPSGGSPTGAPTGPVIAVGSL